MGRVMMSSVWLWDLLEYDPRGEFMYVRNPRAQRAVESGMLVVVEPALSLCSFKGRSVSA